MERIGALRMKQSHFNCLWRKRAVCTWRLLLVTIILSPNKETTIFTKTVVSRCKMRTSEVWGPENWISESLNLKLRPFTFDWQEETAAQTLLFAHVLIYTLTKLKWPGFVSLHHHWGGITFLPNNVTNNNLSWHHGGLNTLCFNTVVSVLLQISILTQKLL